MEIARSKRPGWQSNNVGSGDRHAHVSSRGASKSFQQGICGPAPSLRTQEVEIKYKKPMPPGGRSKVFRAASLSTGPGLTRRFFFQANTFQKSNAIKEIKETGRFCLVGASNSGIYFQAPGGRSKVWTFASRDRCARHTDNSANFGKLFLPPMRVPGIKKFAAKLGRGGGGHAR